MFSQFFGDYLIKKNQITPNQFEEIVAYLNTNRVKLGLIAVSEGLLTVAQSEELNRLQTQMDKRFGDLAMEKGYLTQGEITHLLKLQGNAYLLFIQALEEKQILSQVDAISLLHDYQKENHFSNTDILAIKNGDIDNIISIFVKSEDTFYLSLIGIALRNLIRFIIPRFRIEHAHFTKEYSAQYIACQKTQGDKSGFLGFASDDDSLLLIANPFAAEVFEQVDEDSFDAVCEFINCINGLYATQLSQEQCNIDMLPPRFYTGQTISTTNELMVIPIYFGISKIDLLLSVDSTIVVQ